MARSTDPRILSFQALRRTVGTVAIALPVILAYWGTLFSTGILPTMSDFYYTDMQDIFVGSLLVIGVFLLSYQGYEKAKDEKISDTTLLRIAGVSVIIVALLPTDPAGKMDSVRGTIHLIAAGIFLFTIGYISWAKFSRTHDVKLRRVYKILGAITLGSLFIMAAGQIPMVKALWPNPPANWVFWLETVAVFAYGSAWLIKGKASEGVVALSNRLLGRGA